MSQKFEGLTGTPMSQSVASRDFSAIVAEQNEANLAAIKAYMPTAADKAASYTAKAWEQLAGFENEYGIKVHQWTSYDRSEIEFYEGLVEMAVVAAVLYSGDVTFEATQRAVQKVYGQLKHSQLSKAAKVLQQATHKAVLCKPYYKAAKSAELAAITDKEEQIDILQVIEENKLLKEQLVKVASEEAKSLEWLSTFMGTFFPNNSFLRK